MKKTSNKSSITLELLKEREALEAEIKSKKERLDHINNVIKAELKANDLVKMIVAEREIQLVVSNPYRLDTKRIKAEFPEIYDEYGKFGHTETLKIKKI